MAKEAVREYVGLAVGKVIRTAGGAAIYEALAAIAPKTVQPPAERPANRANNTPSTP